MVPIHQIEHKSDFVRVPAMWKMGGTYLDWDAYPIRDIKPLRMSGFGAIIGREYGGGLNCGVFMAKKGSLLIKMWDQEMHKTYDGGWTTHSNQALTYLAQRVASVSGEVLIMDKDAFEPGSWISEDKIQLFGLHNETASNLDNFSPDTPLPSHERTFGDRWDKPQDFPSWERDYSTTYVLHAYNPMKNGNTVPNFEHISPKYVLARQSNFARLLYPVVRHMYQKGLLEVNDSFVG
jgi:hypothetical protein